MRRAPYSMLGAAHGDDTMLLRPLPYVGDAGWFRGARFAAPPDEPLVVEVVEEYEEDTAPLSWSPSVPLMRDDLVACLRGCGVDNLDAYPAVIVGEETGLELRGYSAVNLVGLVRAASPAGTAYGPGTASRLLDADIDALAIDPARAMGLLMFRLAECVTGVVVHDSVRRAVEARREFRDVRFVEPADWMG
ncbi:MAG: hypothetical protein U0324_28655 [Polyangiales bacterium]